MMLMTADRRETMLCAITATFNVKFNIIQNTNGVFQPRSLLKSYLTLNCLLSTT